MSFCADKISVAHKILLIEGRNLGDAVIATGFLNSFGASFPGIEISVLTRSQFEPVFKNNPYITHYYFAQFPVGTDKHFGFKEAVQLSKMLWQLRAMKFDAIINRTGDFREILLGMVVNRPGNMTIAWQKGHPFRKLVRSGLNFLATNIEVPAETVNIYKAQETLLHALGCCQVLQPRIWREPITNDASPAPIGIHPFAGQECRKWPIANWLKVIRTLAQSGPVVIFCSPKEEQSARVVFREVAGMPGVEICAEPLDKFFGRLSACKLLIGLDSFSVHAAYSLSVPVVMINGANDARIWLPPGSVAVEAERTCRFHPCYNKPRCAGAYDCMADITVQQVLSAVEKRLAILETPA
jgi:heptosyltransferase-3